MAGGKYYSRRCKRVWPIESLPDDLLFDILVRLPADYLYYKARLVCRRWSHIIRSYTKIDRSTFGLLLDTVWRKNHPILVTATQDGQLQINDLAYTCKTLLFGSSNGLALDRDMEDNRLYISNPAVNHELPLPLCCMPNHWYISCGFGYVAASMKYKVISPYKFLVHRLAILTVGVDKSWRDIVEVQHLPEHYKCLIHLKPVTTEGFIHWCCGPYVLTLDVETEIFTMSRLPHYQGGKTEFLSTGRFLSVLVSQSDQLSWNVWVMKSGGNGEWSKWVSDIELGGLKCRLQQFGYDEEHDALKPVGWIKYPEVLAFYCRNVIKRNDSLNPVGWSKLQTHNLLFYNLGTHEINSTKLEHPVRFYSACAHKNNFASART